MRTTDSHRFIQTWRKTIKTSSPYEALFIIINLFWMWNHLEIIKRWHFTGHNLHKQAVSYDLDIYTIWKKPTILWNLCILSQNNSKTLKCVKLFLITAISQATWQMVILKFIVMSSIKKNKQRQLLTSKHTV